MQGHLLPGHSADAPVAGCGCAAPRAEDIWAWARIIFSAILAVNSMAVALAVNTSLDAPEELRTVRLVLLGVTFLVVLLAGQPLLAGAWGALRARRLGVEFLFLLTLAGAFGVSLQSLVRGSGPVYFEVISILVVVYAFGAQLNRAARGRALAVLRLHGAETRLARVRDEAGLDSLKPAAEVLPGEVVIVLPGEMVPVAGELLEGDALFEESLLRGEFAPVVRVAGDRVLAGTAVVDTQVSLRAKAAVAGPASAHGVPADSLDEVVCAVRESLQSTSSAQRTADRLARWFLPLVFSVALLTFLGWSVYTSWDEALFHAMAVLLVACPCALGFATPLALNTAVNRLRDLGITLPRIQDVEALSAVDCVVFDKTGTLSSGQPEVQSIHWEPSVKGQVAQLESMIAAAEAGLSHPYARALEKIIRRPATAPHWVREQLRILPGAGIESRLRIRDGDLHTVCLRRSVNDPAVEQGVEILVDGLLVATTTFAEALPNGRHAVWEELNGLGAELHLFTGDSDARARRTGISSVHAGLSPLAKRDAVKALRGLGRHVLYVGDGINDAAAMAEATVSLAVSHGALLTKAVASGFWDGVELQSIPEALRIARQTLRRVHHNFVWALAYNAAGMVLAAAGYLHPVTAAVLMVASSTLVTWRALALLDTPSALPASSETATPQTLKPAET